VIGAGVVEEKLAQAIVRIWVEASFLAGQDIPHSHWVPAPGERLGHEAKPANSGAGRLNDPRGYRRLGREEEHSPHRPAPDGFRIIIGRASERGKEKFYGVEEPEPVRPAMVVQPPLRRVDAIRRVEHRPRSPLLLGPLGRN
jgi:hypothetical protein